MSRHSMINSALDLNKHITKTYPMEGQIKQTWKVIIYKNMKNINVEDCLDCYLLKENKKMLKDNGASHG